MCSRIIRKYMSSSMSDTCFLFYFIFFMSRLMQLKSNVKYILMYQQFLMASSVISPNRTIQPPGGKISLLES